MPRGGARPGAGRKPKATPGPGPALDKTTTAQLIEALNKPAGSNESAEVQGWRLLWEAQDLRIRLDVRKYLYDKRDGKARQMFEHAGRDGGPVRVVIATNVDLPKM